MSKIELWMWDLLYYLLVSLSRVPCCSAAAESAQQSTLSKDEIEEVELTEKKQREKEKLDQALKQREMEEVTENTGTNDGDNWLCVVVLF